MIQDAIDTRLEAAREQDEQDTLYPFRERFYIPQHGTEDAAYFCGNSLGLQPRSTRYLFMQELEDWAQWGVEGHFQARMPWFSYHKNFSEGLARIVGAQPGEVVAMNTLTVNLQLLLMTFYRPAGGRFKVIMEAGAFPSDQYAVESQVRLYGYDPAEAIIEVAPREGEHTLRTEDILAQIAAAGDSLALLLFSGVQYYTGQLFDIAALTKATHEAGAKAGFDLAHAVGNVLLQLHDWNVDFACWCTYKYLNSGPGSVGGAYIHSKYAHAPELPRLAGWWGHQEDERFLMKKGFLPAAGAAGWQLSNAPVFNMVGHYASLDIFDKTSVAELRQKSLKLTAYLESLLQTLESGHFEIITPADPEQRGCQLSMLFKGDGGKKVFNHLSTSGVIADWREPNVIRVAPVPLYNTFEDCHRLYTALKEGLEAL